MKTGVILYVTDGREAMQMEGEGATVSEAFKLPQVAAVRVAVSEDEIAYNWWQLLTKGMHQVLCMKAAYTASDKTITPFGAPIRLCG